MKTDESDWCWRSPGEEESSRDMRGDFQRAHMAIHNHGHMLRYTGGEKKKKIELTAVELIAQIFLQTSITVYRSAQLLDACTCLSWALRGEYGHFRHVRSLLWLYVQMNGWLVSSLFDQMTSPALWVYCCVNVPSVLAVNCEEFIKFVSLRDEPFTSIIR